MPTVKSVVEFQELPASVWKLLEEQVDAFESAWADGNQPQIADHLIEPDPTDGQLLIELICAEFEFRLQAGIPTTLDEYRERYPQLSSRAETLERLQHLQKEIVPPQSMLESLCRGRSETKPVEHQSKADLLEFASEWRTGNRPRIEDYLERSNDSDRSTLFLELLATEISYRLERHESPQRQEYLQRFPDYELQLQGFDWDGELPIETAAQRIAEFDLLEKRGVGGFGTVWKARDRRLDRIVALKIPHPHRLDAKGRTILVREARAAACLRHPNIVGIHQVEISGKTPYIVLDYVEGISLKKWLAAHPPNANKAAELCISLAHAVQHAHEQGVIHRDLKPANVLVDNAGELHISDFGLAKRQSSEELETRDGLVIGSLPYMSPEQASGRSRTADARTDVYALGAILYEMLTGHPPFEGSEVSILRGIVDYEPAGPRQLRTEIPPSLEAICLKAMAKEPGERYSSAIALSEDLERFTRGEHVEAARMLWLKRLRRGRWQRPARFAGIVIAIVFALGLWPRFHSADARLAVGNALQANASLSVASTGPLSANIPLTPTSAVSSHATSGAITNSRIAPRSVEIRTDPTRADVWVIPLDPINGWPQPEKRIDGATKSPTRFELIPGDYLVVTDLGGGRFMEQDHRVPPIEHELPVEEQSLKWTPNKDDGSIFFEIDIPPAPDLSQFIYVSANEHLVARGTPDEHQVSVPAFYVAKDLITVGDYHHYRRAHYERLGHEYEPKLPYYLKGIALEDDDVIPLRYSKAEAFVSQAGCRLLDEVEWELAASLELLSNDTATSAEWTRSWFNSYPWLLTEDSYRVWESLHLSSNRRFDPFDVSSRAVRGLNRNFLGDPAILNPRDISIASRRPGKFFGHYPDVGFRLGRSVKPRREPADFIQVLP